MQTASVDLDQLKKDTRILDLLERYGVLAERQGNGTQFMARCPFHEDDKPSLSVDQAKNVWHCFGCQKGGSVIDFVMEIENIGFKEAIDKMITCLRAPHRQASSGVVCRASDLNKPDQSSSPAASSFSQEERRYISDVIEYYHRTLSGEDTSGLDYLKSRGLADIETLKAFKVGYCNGTLNKVLPEAAVPILKRIGLLRKDGSETFNGCIVIPVFTETGELGECFARFIVDRDTTNHLYLPGPHRGVLNARAAEVYPDGVILAEAAFDALAVYAIGHKNVIPCYGTGGFTPDHADLLKHHQVKRVYLAFDADNAGDEGAKRLADRLTAAGIECRRVHLPQEIGADLNDYVQALRREGMRPDEIKDAFAELLRKAPQIGYKREKKAGSLTLAEHTAEMLVFQNCEVNYRLRGLFDNTGTSLRVVLSVNLQDSCHTDRFDLYTAKSRVGFAHRAGNRLELPPAKIEDDLNTLIPMLETLLAEGKGKAEEPKGPPPMSETERQEALRLLRSKNLLKRISTDLETVGYVGEDQNKQLGYLIATSRKLDKPLSAIIRSESGAGKSFLMECVAELMPEEEVQYFSRLTPQSLYYMGENELVHKLLIVDERDGSEEAEYPIRTLQTRRKLTLAVPMKDASSGKIKTTMLTINGPIAYMESSTQQTINPENLNRCFELYLDATEQQTARIMSRQRKARTLAGLTQDSRKETTLRVHRNAQRLLRPLNIVIPFADEINFPTQWLRTRRDHERFLSLLEIVAFLHQHQRPIRTNDNGAEYIEATVEDYAITYDLAATVFVQSVHDLTKPARDLYERIKAMVKRDLQQLDISQKDYWFTRRNIREYTRLPDHQIKRTIRQLEDLEYLDVRRSCNGGKHRYRLPSQSAVPALFEGLTTAEELRKSISQTRTTGTKPEQEQKEHESTENKG